MSCQLRNVIRRYGRRETGGILRRRIFAFPNHHHHHRHARAFSSTSHPDIFLAELFGGVINKPKEGTVVQLHEGAVAHVSGLREARIQDVVKFRGEGTQGLVFDLEQNTVAVALLDKDIPEVGTDVNLTGHPPTIPVGTALLGRVVDPLGRPVAELDPQKGAPLDQTSIADVLPTLSRVPPATPTPSPLHPSISYKYIGIMARKPLCQRLGTGIKAMDVFHPIGHGQCLAILGKKGSGKTSLALQAILNQRSRNASLQPKDRLKCIYVAIGQEEVALKRTVDALSKGGCMEYVTVVAATTEMMPGLRYMAPFSGCALGEYWRDQGGRALVVFDDSYSELAKFMPKPEIDTGLSLHGPVLERFAQLSDEKGGGSMTGLALVEGEANEGEAGGGLAHRIYSIADHAVNLNLDLARKRIFPAVDVTYQMNLQSPGSALLPEPTKSFVQNLRLLLAEALDDEVGAKMAEELGIHVMDEAPDDKAEKLEYLAKIRRLFQQGLDEDIDDHGLFLYLLCSLKSVLQSVLQDLDLDTVKQLDHIISKELPKAKGWRRLSADLAALTSQDARLLAEALLDVQSLPSSSTSTKQSYSIVSSFSSSDLQQASGSTTKLPTPAQAEGVYNRLYDMLWKAIDYSKKKSHEAAAAKQSRYAGGAGGGGAARKRKPSAATSTNVG